MHVVPIGWAIIWVLDGPRLSPGLELVFVSTKSLVCNILSLVLSTDCVLSFEVSGMGRYVFPLDRYLLDNFICGVMCRRAWPCSFLGPPIYVPTEYRSTREHKLCRDQ